MHWIYPSPSISHQTALILQAAQTVKITNHHFHFSPNTHTHKKKTKTNKHLLPHLSKHQVPETHPTTTGPSNKQMMWQHPAHLFPSRHRSPVLESKSLMLRTCGGEGWTWEWNKAPFVVGKLTTKKGPNQKRSNPKKFTMIRLLQDDPKNSSNKSQVDNNTVVNYICGDQKGSTQTST